jgi:hypothetical protein
MPWWDVDLTGVFKIPSADPGSSLACCADISSGVHLAYICNKCVVHANYNGTTWANQTASAATTSVAGSALAALFGTNVVIACQEVTDLLAHIHQLSLSASTWGDQSLAPDTIVLPRSAVSGILDTQKKPHWFYITAGDQHVHHLSVDVTNSWIDEDLTKLAGGQPALGPLTSFIDAKGMHVAYIGTDSDIHISAFVQDGIKIGSERWVDQNLTTTTTGPQAATGSNISSFVDGYGDHIIYVASPSHLHRLIFADGKWTDIDLTDTPRRRALKSLRAAR